MIQWPRPLTSKTQQAVWLNKLLNGAKACENLSSPNTLYTQTPKGTYNKPKAGGGSAASPPGKIQRCKINSILSDHLVCGVLNDEGAPTGDTLRVARPSKLRGNQTRSKPFGAGSVNEEIREPYAVNDEIDAIQPEGGTDVADPINVGDFLTWMDANVDGRNWLPAYTSVCVKVAGVEKQMIVAGGPPFTPPP